MRVIHDPSRGQRVPVYAWSSALAPDTERQLVRLASQPWAVDRVAAMADAHVSDGVSVGAVFATERTVVPAALGGDLGCGVRAVRFDCDAASLDRRAFERVLAALGRAAPVGHALHRGRGVGAPDALFEAPLSTASLERTREALVRRHLGTLGGGNHFVELDRDEAGALWALVHTGSRGLGKAVADHHGRAAEGARCDPHAIAGLDAEAPEGRAYLGDVAWSLAFARENRAAILRRVAEVVADVAGAAPDGDELDVHHNFVARESHGGREVLVHRKGAVASPEGALGIVPGSMATATYLVRGRGEPLSFASCSHGAGRVMTRREARDRVDPRVLARRMGRVVFDRSHTNDLVEEAPEAYRDVRAVLDDQRALVDPVLRMEPVMVLKG